MRRTWTFLVIAGLLGLFALLARSSALRMSVTFDEPLHISAAYTIRYLSDFRVNPEDPPLFQRWAALGLPEGSLTPRKSHPAWGEMLDNPYAHWAFATDSMFGSDRLLASHVRTVAGVRVWMIWVGVALGAATVALAWRLSGGAGDGKVAGLAGVIAAVIFAFEPTLLGHTSLVKNDVFCALSFAVVAVALVGVGRRVTVGGVALLALGAAVGVATKFSGLLLGPSVTLALVVRALMPGVWPVLRWQAGSRWARLGVVAGVVTVCAVTSYTGVWAVYGFRYSVSATPGEKMDFSAEQMIGRVNAAWRAHTDARPTTQQIQTYPVPTAIRAMTFAGERGLVPETYAKGFNYTYASTLVRWSYLFSEISFYGWWYYFPMTLVFKLPLGTWGLMVLAVFVAARQRVREGRQPWEMRWGVVSLGIISAYYFLTAMSGGMNIGIRHLLPLFPLGIAAVASTLAGAWDDRRVRAAAVVCLAGLAAETLSAGGRYIAFFNRPALAYGPERLLGDSNLDWGQDLPLLVDWQRRNPGTNLGLIYFGPAMPEAYGIRYQALEGTEYSTRMIDPATKALPGVIVVSASHLQEVTLKREERGHFDVFRRLKPREVLGGTLFVYSWPPTRADIDPRAWRLWAREGSESYLVPTSVRTEPAVHP